MSHDHNHHKVSGKNLGITILLNLFITVAEFLGGIFSGSISLLSDAAHNFSDVLSLIISYTANRLSGQKATLTRTYGLKRSEILAALINSVTLLGLAIAILLESVKRLYKPIPIDSGWVIWLSLLSILVNGLSVLFIKADSRNSINIRSAYLHLFSDMLTSVAVLIGGLAMKYLQWYRVDALFSILIAIYLLFTSWKIIKASLRIFMQFSPENININEITKQVESLEGVKNLHHVHIWQIDEHEIMFEAHLDVTNNITISDFEKILEQVKILLAKQGINHVTIQPEYSVTDNKQLIH
ncbi:MAG: cation diffusion facilitator family transporter [Tenuifilum sp.]|uniref:cation diffusion facilitator family transporter n=1 Tax=Tenuifilum sp. TaxID=2760880 RepID=UPI001B6D7FFB|nr:cation transporter [Bacteroidales bacterium]HOK60049.1 cation diffusion facilitator family transporter [Tenuifilum sp.]MBP9028395.1 cation transporter [Bacteroidales bacterium]HOK84729.1 cation diffusion facilitator family transporter [Tenuifilum sp.]HON69751.1 cation diffusion facilitator family transporter [Tenuifilum sp.]